MMAMWAALWTIAGGTPEKVEHLGQPCRSKNVLAGRVVLDRKSGREWFVLTNMNETSGAELIFIDPERSAGRVYRAPKGAGSWALDEVPGDRLVVGTFYDGQFMVFDLKKMAFVHTAGFPGETYIWNHALGSDGRLYGGSYGNGKLGAFDLKTYAVEDCGAPAPPNLYLRYVSATPDGRILCSFGMDKPTTLLYDPATKKFEKVPVQLEGVSMGVSWNGYFVAGNRVYQGRALDEVKPPPFPTPPADKGGWYADAYTTTPDTLHLHQGSAAYRFTKGDKALTFIADMDLRGGRILAGNRKGELLGVRGQDYFVIKPGDKTLHLKPIPGEAGPRPTLFLKADAKGRLWGGPSFGQTLFYLDTRTKKTVNTGTICDGGGEVYDVTFHDGKVYAAAYSGGNIVRYDPEAPWDQWNNKNPQTIAALGAKGYVRPTGGILTGPDGKLYSGWMAAYGTYGGAVAVTDPATDKTELIENPLGAQAIAGLAVDAQFAYIGTSLGANGLPDKKGESAKFGIVDLASKKAVFEKPFAGASNVSGLALDAKTKVLAFLAHGRIQRFDTSTREFLPDLPSDTPGASGGLCAPGDGRVYYGSEKTLIALDVRSGHVERLADAPAKIGRVVIGPDGSAYISCGVDVYRVRSKSSLTPPPRITGPVGLRPITPSFR